MNGRERKQVLQGTVTLGRGSAGQHLPVKLVVVSEDLHTGQTTVEVRVDGSVVDSVAVGGLEEGERVAVGWLVNGRAGRDGWGV